VPGTRRAAPTRAHYCSSNMTGFGPIFQLTVWGTVCPCLEKSEHKNARLAVQAINKACRRIQWQPGAGGPKKGGFLGGFFGESKAAGSGSGSSSQAPCLAKLVLHDSGGDGQPELFVDPIRNVVEAEQQPQTNRRFQAQHQTAPRRQGVTGRSHGADCRLSCMPKGSMQLVRADNNSLAPPRNCCDSQSCSSQMRHRFQHYQPPPMNRFPSLRTCATRSFTSLWSLSNGNDSGALS